ncbi:MAG: hypothetical protein AAFN13_19245, partial [Bacteroidota bacterium]
LSPAAGASVGAFPPGPAGAGIFLDASGGALIALGTTPSDLRGASLAPWVTPEFEAALAEAHEGRASAYITRFRDASGRKRAYAAAVVPVPSPCTSLPLACASPTSCSSRSMGSAPTAPAA